MKHRMICGLVGACGAMIVSHESQAAYIGLGTKLHTTVMAGGLSRDVYRLYAVFNNAGDAVTAVGGSVANGPATIKSYTIGGGAGANFFNSGGGSSAPGTSSDVFSPAAAQWDTFATIGVTKNDVNDPDDDLTTLSPGFPTFISSNKWGPTNSSWFTNGPQPQGLAGNGVVGTFIQNGTNPINGLGVLIAQLTVNNGQHVAGTLNVGGQLAVGTPWSATGQNFWTTTFPPPPAPGTIVVLAVAGLVGVRRRRA